MSDRRAELTDSLAALRSRIAAACVAAHRDPTEVTLIAVTKTYPASDVAHLAALGVTDVGENREQEATPKSAEARAAGVEVRWHHVGQLQRNKARAVAAYADMVHSVDRLPLVSALGVARRRLRDAAGVPVLDVLVQVNLDAPAPASHDGPADPQSADPRSGVAHRGGAAVGDLEAIAAAIAAEPALRLAGLMNVAPLDVDPAASFASLAEVAADLRQSHPDATVISAGMSADLEAAILAGATHVRVGTALLGTRAKLG